jgi:hypothetical protein
MKLIADWRHVLRKAWSVRLMILAGLLSGLEVTLPLFIDAMPRNLFAVLSMLTISGAFMARIVAQKGFGDD